MNTIIYKPTIDKKQDMVIRNPSLDFTFKPIYVDSSYIRGYTPQIENPRIISEEQEIIEEPSKPSKSEKYSNSNKFKKDLTEAYTKALEARGLNTKYAKYLVAQDALESGWGSRYTGNYNFGNITIGSDKTASYTEGNDHDAKGNPIKQKFRNYDSLEDYVNAKIDLLNNKRYNAFADDSDNAETFFSRIVKGGYAEDPKYLEKILRVYYSV